MRRTTVPLILLAVLLIVSACGQAVTQSQAISAAIALNEPALPSTAVAVTDTTSLAEALRATGAFVADEGSVSQTFLQRDGVILRVNHQHVQVYEYPDDAAARADAARFSPDGAWFSGDVGATLVNWIATPHLYRASRLIAVYVGDSQSTLSLLESVLGEPFAGGANPYQTLLRTES